MPDDATLLSDYLAGTQAAFAELVHRHMNLVYAAARRQVRDPHLAEDVAQAVFIILSRRAGSLRASPTIAGWLVKTTRYVASNALRAQQRRKKHEQVAAMLATQLDTENRSSEITAILDDALGKLRPNDRSAISMRYLQNRSVEEISSELRISPPAAAKRIERALDRLRSHLTRRGVVASVVAITAALSAESSIAAPAPLVATAAAGTFNTAASSLAKGTLTAMLRTKLLAAAAAAAVLVTGAGVGTHFLRTESTALAAAPSAPPAAAFPVAPAVTTSPGTTPTDPSQSLDEWRLRSDHAGDYALGSTAEVHDGQPAALLMSVVDHPMGMGTRGRVVSAEPYRGKRMTLSADLKLEEVSAVGGLFVIAVDEPGHILINGDYSDKHLLGTLPWAHYTFTFVVPPTATKILYGMNVRGTGKLWGSNFKLDEAVPGAPVDDDTAWHAWTYTPKGFSWGKDSSVQRNGHPTWFIDATNSMPGEWAYLDSNQRGIHETLAGKRMRYSVWIKCENVIPPTGITFRTMGPGLSISPRYGKPGLIGTADWKKYEMVVEVNDKATSICPGVKIQSSGKVWIDEPKVDVVDKSVPLTK